MIKAISCKKKWEIWHAIKYQRKYYKKINKWIRSHKSKIKNEHIYNDWSIYKKHWLKLKHFIVHSLVNLAIVCLYFTPCLAHKKWKLMLFYHLLSRVRLSACHFSHPHPYVLGFFFFFRALGLISAKISTMHCCVEKV